MLRYRETLCLLAASSGMAELSVTLLKSYEAELFPEVDLDQTSFEDEAKETIEKTKDLAFALDSEGGRLTMTPILKREIDDIHKRNQKREEDADRKIRERWFKKYGVWPK